MSLNYNLKRINDYEATCFYVDKHPEHADSEGMFGRHRYEKDGVTYVMDWVLHTLILLSMRVQLGQITEANVPEWYRRIHIMERWSGTFINKMVDGKPEPRYVTVDDIKKFIGLGTNVSTVTAAKWNRHMMEVMSYDVRREQQ